MSPEGYLVEFRGTGDALWLAHIALDGDGSPDYGNVPATANRALVAAEAGDVRRRCR